MKILRLNTAIKVVSFIMLIVLFAGMLPTPAKALTEPEITSEAALLIEASNGQVLYSKNHTVQYAPASLTKVMTVMLALEAYTNGDVALNDIVTVSENASFDITPDGSSAGLKAGEEITFEDLLYCAMLASANEACNVIAEFISGSVESFINLMNTRAIELGCTGTHFANTHGMPNDNHYSTAYDLYLISQSALEYPLFKKMISTVSYDTAATNLSEEREIRNTNKLLDPNSHYYYEYATGLKTGYTDKAGYCLISTATKSGRELISVVMGATSVVLEDGTTQSRQFTESRTLLDWGFKNFSYKDILSTINLIAEIPVALGKGSSSVVLRPASTITVLLPNDVDVKDTVFKTRIYSEETGETLEAPLYQGTVLGEIQVTLNGVDYGTVELIANTTVELNRTAFMKQEVKNTLSNKYVKLVIILLLLLLVGYIALIVVYNIKRRQKKRRSAELARKRIEELRRNETRTPTTGKSFEEIEELHRNRK